PRALTAGTWAKVERGNDGPGVVHQYQARLAAVTVAFPLLEHRLESKAAAVHLRVLPAGRGPDGGPQGPPRRRHRPAARRWAGEQGRARRSPRGVSAAGP